MRIILLLALLLIHSVCDSNDQSSPNIVWLTTEDNSPHQMKLYHEEGISMPAIEKLAEQGIVFDNAFSNAPVCSVARSTLITGCYAPRIFTQFHRKAKQVPLPQGIMPFPFYLKQAGYYTTNNHKQDYNFILPDGVWDESSKKASYKNRKPGQPFFHVQNHTVTHEGNLHFNQKDIDDSSDEDLDHIKVFPYHPDTKTFRYSYYHFQNRHLMADQQMGKFIADLEEQGLMDDTIIFYFGDHGGVLPRSKGYAYESGLQVPLVVYVPEKWKHLFHHSRGSRAKTFVAFIDFAPTVLSLAGITPPKNMDGTAVMGKFSEASKVQTKNTALGHADRFDEKYDLVRTLRVGKYKYIRNYQPFNVDALFNFYRYKMLAFQEWEILYNTGKLSAEQRQFFEPRSAEALYDLEQDPHEVNDLSTNPEYRPTLVELREQLKEKLLALPDLSFYPESFLLENGFENPVAFGQKQQEEIKELMAIADLNLTPFNQVVGKIEKALNDNNPWKRYWGLVVCTSFGEVAKVLLPKIEKLLQNDTENLVRMRALEFLALYSEPVDVKVINELMKKAKSETEANLMLNSLALIKNSKPHLKFNLKKEIFPPEWYDRPNDLVNRRIDYINDIP
ncbi:MAG: sulfatase [Flavobacteriaceae bacterium]|jgi:arylsulfatase A-like enzyme|nr:sulfatase [Flavobacteriaceae bacterium]